ncbi:MAG: hypothetical protein IJI23_00255 [Lachnospiraceae bacterium]|nr:hypothetical protein [Lachnospiraceae bacterium]
MSNIIKPLRKTKKDARSLQKTANDLIQLAKEGGVEQNFFFTTTFERYITQLSILDRLGKKINEAEDLVINKEYIKGKEAPVTHPAISEYNKTSTAANQTAQTLLKIILTFSDGSMTNNTNEDEEEIDL